ncbi:CFAP47, partial [Symbiodinium sp. KB8]
QVGEYVVEVQGTAVLPPALEEFSVKSELQAAIPREVFVPWRNPLVEAAVGTAFDRLDKRTRSIEIRAREVRANELWEGRAKLPGVPYNPAFGTLYSVEVNSPYFEVPEEFFLPNIYAEKEVIAIPDAKFKFKRPFGRSSNEPHLVPSMATPTTSSLTSGSHTEDAMAYCNALAKMSAEGRLMAQDETKEEDEDAPPRSLLSRKLGANAKKKEITSPLGDVSMPRLPVIFRPQEPGRYRCQVVMRSYKDMRVFNFEMVATSSGEVRALELSSPAGQKLTQEIPIKNGTDSGWSMRAKLEGESPKAFSCPSMLSVPAGDIAYLPLTFTPEWMGQVSAVLKLTNHAGGDEHVIQFNLTGVGREPLALEHVVVECQARERVEQQFTVHNKTDKRVTYTVQSDMPSVSGDSSIVVGPKTSKDYTLTMTPQLGGTYAGKVTFLDEATGHYQYYTIELEAAAPEPEGTLDIEAFVRQGMSVNISLANPLEEPVTFEVSTSGEGLICDEFFHLEPRESGTFEVVFAPLKVGRQRGSITFVDER